MFFQIKTEVSSQENGIKVSEKYPEFGTDGIKSSSVQKLGDLGTNSIPSSLYGQC